TLVNQLLAQDHGRRLVILVNDFGRLNIDARLIRNRDGDTISLANGCVCCNLAGDLAGQLTQLAQSGNPPDAVLLESSGLSDPHGIAQVALTVGAVALEAVVTLVDAEAWSQQFSDPVSRM